jgi:hypothetical protein
MMRLYACLISFSKKGLKPFMAKRLNHVLNCKLLINARQLYAVRNNRNYKPWSDLKAVQPHLTSP